MRQTRLAWAVLAVILPAIAYCVGLVIDGYARILGAAPWSPFLVFLVGTLGLAAICAFGVIAYRRAIALPHFRASHWLIRLVVHFAFLTLAYVGIEAARKGPALDWSGALVLSTVMSVYFTFFSRRMHRRGLRARLTS